MKPKYYFLLLEKALGQYFLLTIAVLALPLLMYFGTGSVDLKCQKSIKRDTVCQLKHAHLYGLVKSQSTLFHLSGVETRPVVSCAKKEISETGTAKCDEHDVWLETSIGTFSLRKLRYSSLEEAEINARVIRSYIQVGVKDFYITEDLNILNDIMMTIILGGTLLLFSWLVSRYCKS
ncbi:hypothetical protein [Pantanalinema sp. GBBB05]|uniref:hypothetical protein n=1 Tax=Pantanalinema sp. GBBB05 TaxID=2604139 RepID=UPI001E161A2A|nr:hypothetical protein [Pantanalinema sp. GBBB05]